MPWMIKKQDDKWCVFKQGTDGQPTGKAKGCHDTKAEAQDQMAALYVHTDERSLLTQLRDAFAAAVDKVFGRAIAMQSIGAQVANLITDSAEYGPDDYPWLSDIYHDGPAMFVIVTAAGRLYRHDVTLEGDTVTISPRQEVEVEFEPRTRTVILRQLNGKVRWFSISCTAVLNRVGEIDSRSLFDSFITHAEASGEYPFRTFYHNGEALRTGQCDAMFRSEDLFITTGEYDLDSELAQVEIAAREAEPDEWGESIGYLPSGEPELVDVGDGVTVPVYTRGVIREISTVTEAEAASWFTATTEVKRMKDKRVEAALRKLFSAAGKEDEADAFIEKLDSTQTRIETERRVTRTQEGAGTGDPPSEPAPAADPAQERAEVELDDAAITAIVEKLAGSDTFVSAIAEKVSAHMSEAEGEGEDEERATATALTVLGTELRSTLAQLDGRVKQLELPEAERQRVVVEDQPRSARLRATYRPRQAPAPAENGGANLASVAEATLAKARTK